MSEEFNDEVTSINSIYGDNTLVKLSEGPSVYSLTLPSRPAISVRVDFPSDYPNTPPSILGTQSVGDDIVKGEGAYLVELLRNVLAEVYTPGAPCLYDLVEETGARLQALGMDQVSRNQEQQAAQANGVPISAAEPNGTSDNAQHLDDLGDPPPWTLSEIITEKKSVFIARAAAVTSVDQARQNLAHLLATDKKVAKSTHNITAWRLHGENGVQYQDCDDDGETAAGGRLLHLLELMGVWDAMVVVTRWYGGVQLGPDRFRIINQTARDALVKGGFVIEAGKESGKKKSGKNACAFFCEGLGFLQASGPTSNVTSFGVGIASTRGRSVCSTCSPEIPASTAPMLRNDHNVPEEPSSPAFTLDIASSTAALPMITTTTTSKVREESFPGIPSKFLLERQAFPADEFYSITMRPSETALEISSNATAAAETGTDAAGMTTHSAKFREVGDLPDMPDWAMGLLAGCLVCMFTMAVGLYFVNFPPPPIHVWRLWHWVIWGWRRGEYQRVGDGADETDGDYATSSCREKTSAKSRRRKNLSIDTSVQYTGLGIAVAPEDRVHGHSKRERRRSYDEEALRLRQLPLQTPARATWKAITAPIPSLTGFGREQRVRYPLSTGPHDDRFVRESELESGIRTSHSAESLEMFDPLSPVHREWHDAAETHGEHDNIYGRIGGGMERAAGILARMMHDQVRADPEEGLLLPVRDCEREKVGPELGAVT